MPIGNNRISLGCEGAGAFRRIRMGLVTIHNAPPVKMDNPGHREATLHSYSASEAGKYMAEVGFFSFIEHLRQASQRMRTLADSTSDPAARWRYLVIAESLDNMVERAKSDAAKLGLRVCAMPSGN